VGPNFPQPSFRGLRDILIYRLDVLDSLRGDICGANIKSLLMSFPLDSPQGLMQECHVLSRISCVSCGNIFRGLNAIYLPTSKRQTPLYVRYRHELPDAGQWVNGPFVLLALRKTKQVSPVLLPTLLSFGPTHAYLFLVNSSRLKKPFTQFQSKYLRGFE